MLVRSKGSRYSRMDQVKFVEDGLFKAVFHKFYVVHSWIPWLKYYLTHFRPMFHFNTPWKHQKSSGLLMSSGDIKKKTDLKWVYIRYNKLCCILHEWKPPGVSDLVKNDKFFCNVLICCHDTTLGFFLPYFTKFVFLSPWSKTHANSMEW